MAIPWVYDSTILASAAVILSPIITLPNDRDLALMTVLFSQNHSVAAAGFIFSPTFITGNQIYGDSVPVSNQVLIKQLYVRLLMPVQLQIRFTTCVIGQLYRIRLYGLLAESDEVVPYAL